MSIWIHMGVSGRGDDASSCIGINQRVGFSFSFFQSFFSFLFLLIRGVENEIKFRWGSHIFSQNLSQTFHVLFLEREIWVTMRICHVEGLKASLWVRVGFANDV